MSMLQSVKKFRVVERNDTGKFKVFRHKQGQPTDEAKQRLPLRKGVMDIPLRAHGLIRKLPKQNRYQVTLKGVRLINVVNAFWAASAEDLMKIAA